MPFVIRLILQRLLLVLYSVLAIWGINPQVTFITEEEASTKIEERKEIVAETLQEKSADNPVDTTNNNDSFLQNVEKTIEEKLGQTTENSIDKSEESLTASSFASETTIDDVLFNIICVKRGKNLIEVYTGSGVMISSKGAVLTNAHVGQFFLLKNKPRKNYLTCALHRENIPTYGFEAELLYIPPDWVRANSNVINMTNPTGTGEKDYALLLITKNTNPSLSIPEEFEYLDFSTSEKDIDIGLPVYAAGYPGTPSNLFDITHSVDLKKELTRIIDYFTFGRNTLDIFEVGKTSVGAKGASGGGIFSLDDKLLGLIVTTNGDQGNANLNALSLSYINNDLKKDIGESLSSYLSGDLKQKSEDFNKYVAPQLTDLILENL